MYFHTHTDGRDPLGIASGRARWHRVPSPTTTISRDQGKWSITATCRTFRNCNIVPEGTQFGVLFERRHLKKFYTTPTSGRFLGKDLMSSPVAWMRSSMRELFPSVTIFRIPLRADTGI
jgi:hypothetical protein